jgi:hypothetical protein
MGATLGSHAIRIAVKDRATNARMLEILTRVAQWSVPCSAMAHER